MNEKLIDLLKEGKIAILVNGSSDLSKLVTILEIVTVNDDISQREIGRYLVFSREYQKLAIHNKKWIINHTWSGETVEVDDFWSEDYVIAKNIKVLKKMFDSVIFNDGYILNDKPYSIEEAENLIEKINNLK